MKEGQGPNPDYPLESEDDLEKIKGIGSSTAEKLRQHGIHRYRDLMEREPQELQDLLKDEVPFINGKRTTAWIAEARRLHEEKYPSGESSSGESEEEGDLRALPAIPIYTNWREAADFFVSFGYQLGDESEESLKTKVYHSQEDTFMSWDGIAAEELITWMIQQANLPGAVLQGLPAFTGEKGLPPESGQELALDNLWVEGASPDSRRSGFLSTQIRVRFELQTSGIEESALDQEGGFEVEYYLIDRAGNQSSLVARTRGQFAAGQSRYPIRQSFLAPPVGDYRLYLVARVLGPQGAMTHLQGPVIHVKQASGQPAA